VARPTKLTPEASERICEALRDGAPRAVAAEAADVGDSTLYRWLERGDRARSGRFREFWEAVRAAEAEAMTRALRVVWQAIEAGDGRLAMEFLSRRWPADFGRRPIELTGADGGPLQVEQASSAKATLTAKIERLAARREQIRREAAGEGGETPGAPE
jgi:hypothetical protein